MNRATEKNLLRVIAWLDDSLLEDGHELPLDVRATTARCMLVNELADTGSKWAKDVLVERGLLIAAGY